MSDVFFIAEAGVNHNGSLERALALVHAAARARADAVKFQTFKATAVAAESATKAAYQARQAGADGSQLAMLKALELSEEQFAAIAAECRHCDIEFMSTAFDVDSLNFLVRRLGVQRLKCPSGEITNGPLLLAMARTGLPIILSTGMADIVEIADALAVVAFGYGVRSREPLGIEDIRAEAKRPEVRATLAKKITILHCTSSYPAPVSELNLLAIRIIAEQFGLPVGYSDHSEGGHVSVAAVALGASCIEKHFTLDRGLPGPDHKASLEPDELRALVQQIRDVSAALGEPKKGPTPSEQDTKDVARRSLFATEPIRAGTPFASARLAALRPAGGLSPMVWWDLQRELAPRDFEQGEMIERAISE